LSRRERRSDYARQRRWLSRFLSLYGRKPDFENVNVLSPSEIYDLIFSKFGTVDVGLIYVHVVGEVLSDGRGEGSLERLNPEKVKQRFL
jgi:hypothetical protein